MGGYATRVNRFLSLTLSLMMTVTPPLLSLRYALGPARYSALSHLSVHPAPLGSLPWLVAGDDQHELLDTLLNLEILETMIHHHRTSWANIASAPWESFILN